MPICGVLTQKRSILNPSFSNRYFVNAASIELALAAGVLLADAEADMFSDQVEFYNVHAWIPDSSPNIFRNEALMLSGGIETFAGIASFICVEFLWGGGGSSYPSTKSYRVEVDSAKLNGTYWDDGYYEGLGDVAEQINGLDVILCDRAGNALTGPTVNRQYVPRQVSKRWYNRTS